MRGPSEGRRGEKKERGGNERLGSLRGRRYGVAVAVAVARRYDVGGLMSASVWVRGFHHDDEMKLEDLEM